MLTCILAVLIGLRVGIFCRKHELSPLLGMALTISLCLLAGTLLRKLGVE